MVCPFHTDEWSAGVRGGDGSYAHECQRHGHPGDGPWRWLEVPAPPDSGLAGLADELDLASKLPAALAMLGDGWWEYGLVERAYADLDPAGWRRMVDQWSHTAVAPIRYSASAYLAGTLGRLSSTGAVAYHAGPATGRWSYNAGISWWSTVPPATWEQRTSWVDLVGDHSKAEQKADLACLAYVRPET